MRKVEAVRRRALAATSPWHDCLFAMLLATAAGMSQAQWASAPASDATSACPAEVAAASLCVSGRDSAGAYYWLATPPDWGGTLVVHAHGGPEFGRLRVKRPLEDLRRWSIWTRAGYALAVTGYHQNGVAVVSAAADLERTRSLFISRFGVPRRTILHGNSWGASIAAKAAELYGSGAGNDGKPPYDGVLLTSGVLGGGSKSYDFRPDLRVVYEAVCGNHPRPSEPRYPLWEGLPPGGQMTRAELSARVDECTGVAREPAARTAAQQRRLDSILRVIRIPERSLIGHLYWATRGFQDIVFTRLDGRNPFGNEGVRYVGSADDDALNARVARYRADPAAQAAFAADADLQGRIAVPVLTLHAIDDPTAFVELESTFRDTMARGGSAERLVQVFSDDHEHSYLADAEYVAVLRSLLVWVERGDKPTPQSVASRCGGLEAAFDPATGCRFRPDYRPAPLAARVPPRQDTGPTP
jgi:alpha-beta hydrolase superfamily lysophospholipase